MKNNGMLKKLFAYIAMAAMMISIMPASVFAYTGIEDNYGVDLEWYNYSNNQENNRITERNTPMDSDTTTLKWGVKYGSGWGAAPTPPLVLDGKIYIGQGNRIYELNKENGEIIRKSDEMAGNVGYAMNPILYADGKLFVQVGNGIIQAIDFDTLKCIWHSQKLGGQTLSNISYTKSNGKGYVYTGTWTGEKRDGSFFAISTDNEGKIGEGSGKGGWEKKITWQFQPSGASIDENTDIKYDKDLHDTLGEESSVAKRGFYWVGAYACENFVAVGSDDGTNEGDYTANGILYTLDPITGEIIDKIDNIKGDIRSSVVYDNGRLYFCTKGGLVCRADVDDNGNLSNYNELQLKDTGGKNRMITSTPVVYKGKIYTGASGSAGQFNPDGGHVFAVIDDTKDKMELMYNIPVPGYPQASVLLSNAYENVDFDGKNGADGRVYIYFTYNAKPGGIYYFYDTPEATEPLMQGKELFVPDKSMQQFCISTICADREGTLYYKNDSNYVMAVEKNMAFIEDMKIKSDDGLSASWDKAFDRNDTSYELKVPSDSQYVTMDLIMPKTATVTVNGKPYAKGMQVKLDNSATQISVTVSLDNHEKTYKLTVKKISMDATLKSLNVNSKNSSGEWHEITPAFSPNLTDYIVDVSNIDINGFWRIWPEATDKNATVEVIGVENVKNVTHPAQYFGVYPEDGRKDKKVKVQIKVTSEKGDTSKIYNLTILKKVKVTGIALDKTNLTIDVTDGEIRLNPVFTPENATDKSVKWYAMDSDSKDTKDTPIKIEENGNGTIIPLRKGNGIVTAIPNDNTGISAKVNITVTDKAKDFYDKIKKDDALKEDNITIESKAHIDMVTSEYKSLNEKQRKRADEFGAKAIIDEAQSKYDALKVQEDKEHNEHNDNTFDQDKNKKDESTNVKTGDTANLSDNKVLMILSVTVLVVLAIERKKDIK